MANREEIITGRGVLSGEGRNRECRFRVIKTSLCVEELPTPVKSTYSNLSITDSDNFPDGNYELDYLAARGRTSKKSRAVIRCAARPRWFPPRASSRRAQRDPRNGLPQAQQKAQKSGKHLPSTVFQLARRARAQPFAQDQAQIERAHMNQ